MIKRIADLSNLFIKYVPEKKYEIIIIKPILIKQSPPNSSIHVGND